MVTENSSVQVVLTSQQVSVDTTFAIDPDRILTLYVPSLPIDESFAFRNIKRVIDILVSAMALVVLAPVMVVIALLIRLHDGGPAIYRQPRIGRYGVPFMFCKFRSMRMDADKIRNELLGKSDAVGIAFKMKNDPRVTPIGRFLRRSSLDELPQLFAVLCGHMSIVGPRPHLPEEVKAYAFEQRARLLVKPGLICIREVSGRSHLSFEEWIKLDLEYVRRRSIKFDTIIFLKAFPAVIRGEGAY